MTTPNLSRRPRGNPGPQDVRETARFMAMERDYRSLQDNYWRIHRTGMPAELWNEVALLWEEK